MTMIEPAGKLTITDAAPYVYFIKKGYLLYIGETQRNPILRWSEHLQDGSFQRALLKADEEVYLSDLHTEFYAYRCILIETTIKEVERKRATQYVEDALHNTIICRGLPLSNIKLISDTTRTAPLGYKYRHISSIVDEIYDKFASDICNPSYLPSH
jgi:predicted GIY-YIG superfamily endonuclease